MHVNDLLHAAGVAPLLIGASAKGMVILMVGAASAMLARGASAATRHLIWTLTMTGALVAPVVAAFVPRWSIPLPRWSVAETPRLDAVTVSPALSGASSNIVLSLAPRAPSGGSIAGAAAPARRGVRRTSSSPAPTVSAAGTTGPTRDAYVARSPSVGATASVVPWLVIAWALGAIMAIVPSVVGMARLALVARRARDMRGGRWALLVPSVMRELDDLWSLFAPRVRRGRGLHPPPRPEAAIGMPSDREGRTV